MITFELVAKEHRKHLRALIMLPTRATENAVAYDFYSPDVYDIPPMESAMIWTDIKARFPADVALLLNVRSSMGAHPVMMANTQGWVESDYCDNPGNDGNIGIRLFNLGKTAYHINKGDRIAQGMFVNFLTADNGNSAVKRIGGFGSTSQN